MKFTEFLPTKYFQLKEYAALLTEIRGARLTLSSLSELHERDRLTSYLAQLEIAQKIKEQSFFVVYGQLLPEYHQTVENWSVVKHTTDTTPLPVLTRLMRSADCLPGTMKALFSELIYMAEGTDDLRVQGVQFPVNDNSHIFLVNLGIQSKFYVSVMAEKVQKISLNDFEKKVRKTNKSLGDYF